MSSEQQPELPSTPEAAAERLSELTGNAEWGAKLLSADATVKAQFDSLSKMIASESPPVTAEQMAEQQQSAEAKREAGLIVDHLTSAGLPPSTNPTGAELEDYISGKRSITPELRAAVEAKITGWTKDKEFGRRLVDGDGETNRLFNIANAMLTASVETTP